MAIERVAVISQKEAMQSQQPAPASQQERSQPEPKKDMTSKGIRGFTLWNRGEQVVGGVVGAGALALGALPIAAGAGLWMGWNEAQIRVANRIEEKRQKKKASEGQETVVFDAKKSAQAQGNKKEYALAG